MKRTFLLISAFLLSLTAWGQKVMLYMAGNQTFECDVARLDSIVFSESQTNPAEEIVVTVDANGNADGGHQYMRIDESTFLIDELKYGYSNGSLAVIGYDPIFFSGIANPISRLIYNGRTMIVTGISQNAFSNCTSLTSITIPESVTVIGYEAFEGCTNLHSVTIPNSVPIIGVAAFSGCTSLTSVTIGSGVTDIYYDAFRNCSALTSINIPNSVISIGNNAFYGCIGMTSVTIGSGVTTIYDETFTGCYFRTDLFINNSSLTSDFNWGATLCDDETSEGLLIKDNQVVKCRLWSTSVTIPNSVTKIVRNAFSGCNRLTSIDIPNSVTSIGRNAFEGCDGLTSIIIESGNTVYDSRNNCNAIIMTASNTLIKGCLNTIIPNSVANIGEGAFRDCSGLTSIDIPNSVTNIGRYAFGGCSGMTSVTIGSGVTDIGTLAFKDCTSLTDVYCYAENVPSTVDNPFTSYDVWGTGSPLTTSATLHVPAGSLEAYRTTEPWSSFGSIVAIE